MTEKVWLYVTKFISQQRNFLYLHFTFCKSDICQLTVNIPSVVAGNIKRRLVFVTLCFLHIVWHSQCMEKLCNKDFLYDSCIYHTVLCQPRSHGKICKIIQTLHCERYSAILRVFNHVVKFLHNNSHQIILTVIKDRD